MMNYIKLLCVFCIGFCTLIGCEATEDELTEYVVDAYQREVYYSEDADRFLCLGSGTLRLYSYIADVNQLVGVEEIEKSWSSIGRPYNLLLENVESMDTVSNGGVGASLDFEKILLSNPDVIFVSDFYDIDTINSLSESTNIPVVTISYNDVAGNIFNEVLYHSLEVIGEVTNHIDRSTDLINYMKDTKEDLISRSSMVALDKTVYIGGQAYKGKHGIESTSGDYKIFDILQLNNIVSSAGISGHIIVDKEEILNWDPDIIIMDANGYQLLLDDYANNKDFYEGLTAFQNNEVYLQMPFNYYSSNIEIALANAYYIGVMLYPDSFEGIDPALQFDEISQFFLGIDTYEMIGNDYFGGFQTVQLNAE